MALAFGAPASPYRVFARASPHRGLSTSAHLASFVMALDPDAPVDEEVLQRTVTHELVHEWVHLDGSADDVTWFNEGAADDFSLALSLRNGLIGKQTHPSPTIRPRRGARLGAWPALPLVAV